MALKINGIRVAGVGADGKDGVGVPSGGAQGQMLVKKSITDYDTEWVDLDLSAYETTANATAKLDEAKAYADTAAATAASGKADAAHNHDDVYYTEAEIDSLLLTKSDSDHNHDSVYDAFGSADAVLADVRTYVDEQLSAKANADHNHDSAYDVKGSSDTALNNAKTYTDEKISVLLDGADDTTLDSIKELADAIKNNDNAIDALNEIAAGKADANHNHDTSYDAYGAADTALASARTYVDERIATIPTPDVSGQIAAHNTDTSAHADIRDAMSEVQTRADEAYALAESKQDKLTGTVDQVVSFDEDGNPIAISAITIDEIDAICNGVSILSAEAVRY